jgi:DNA-binding winged helix-turn-helix (wHTH) protein/cytochrome c-type biogenesis protein CcmH/NrfG
VPSSVAALHYNPAVPRSDAFAFGPFELDTRHRRLIRDGEPVALSQRQFDLLCTLVSRAGEVLSKDQLIEVAWRDVAVSDNSLEQAISGLRRLLADRSSDGGVKPSRSGDYIETEARRGYRFAAPVTRIVTRETDAALDALLAPHRAWIEGRAALETLERDRIRHAREVFEGVLQRVPEQAPVHVGLANACAMQFEMTRADLAPDLAALERAAHHAREACRLDPDYGEAWATLGFVLDRTGQHADAVAAGRRSVALEPDNWRHHLRLAYHTWGEERLRAARRTLALLPDFPLGHWLAATVHVARGSVSEAVRELDAGIAVLEIEAGTPPRFSAVALHWLRGLIHLAEGDEKQALESFNRELAAEASGNLYARECCANTWYAIGALHFWRGRFEEARKAFESAVDRVTVHPLARVGLAVLSESAVDCGVTSAGHARASLFDVALCRAAAILMEPRTTPEPPIAAAFRAARIVDDALVETAAPSAGWLLPVEPLLRVRTAPEAWAPVLGRLRARAA